jgi:Galactose oxidase, central domain
MGRSMALTRSLIGFALVIVLAGCGRGGTAIPLLVVSSTVLPPAGVATDVYPSFTFTATGGLPPLTWSEVGALPPGLMFSSSGLLSGTPTSAGSFRITVTVKDGSSSQQTASQQFTILIKNPPPPAINTSPPPPTGAVGLPYNPGLPGFTFTATGGLPPLTWSEVGALPPGLMFSSSGLLSGTPTSAGSFPITVLVQDSVGQSANPQNFTLEVSGQGSGFALTGSMATARSEHTATLLNNGKVLVIGGYSFNGELSSAELFDPATGAFTPTGSMVTARFDHTATLLSNGKVLVTGGRNSGTSTYSTAELFDPATGAFTPTGSLATERAMHTATLLNSGKVLVTGGFNSINPGALATAELFDPATGAFTPTGSMAAGRESHTATLLNNGKVLITGGNPDNFPSSTDGSAELFDPATGAFRRTGSMAAGRAGHTAALLNGGRVLVTGGFYVPTDLSPGGTNATAELFDPATGAFTPTGSMETARSLHTATLRNDGTVLVAGGEIASNGLASAELFNPADGTFLPTGSMGTIRSRHTATLLLDGRVLVTGGICTMSGTCPLVLSTAELFQ